MSRKGDGKDHPFFSRDSISLLGLSFLIVLVDQASKALISRWLSAGQPFPVIQGVFHLTFVQNTGAAFGMLKGMNWLLLGFSIIVVCIIFLYWKSAIARQEYRLPVALILGGAVGNIIDRILFGYVIDFLDFRIWPVFNLADSAITVGALILAWQWWKEN